MPLQPFFIREQIIKSVREYFYSEKFHEAIVPILNVSVPLEPNIFPLKAGSFFLPTSLEKHLKKMLSAGIGRCFAVEKSFRNFEDQSPIRGTEFLLLEWYRENSGYRRIIEETRDLILKIQKDLVSKRMIKAVLPIGNWRIFSMADLFEEYASLNLEEITGDEEMVKCARKKGYRTKKAVWEELFYQIFLNEIEPELGTEPVFITDYPARISPLCGKRRDKPFLAERFELYIDGMELVDGNTENTDTDEIKRLFKSEKRVREKKKIASPPSDTEFLSSLGRLTKGKYSGAGLGLDRLTMIFSGISDIREIDICY